MTRFIQLAALAVALGATAAAQAAPPAPPAPPAPRLKARPAPAPAPPAAPAAPAKPVRGSSYLGVDIRDVTHDNMAALKVKEPRGVEITLVDRDAPAGRAGLKERDVVLSFNGRNIQNSEELRKLIRETPPGQTVELGISRDGQPLTVKPQLADRRKVIVMKAPDVRIRIPRVDVPAFMVYPRRHGVVVENLTPQLGEVFGVKDGEGVLVRSVEKDSPGEAAGLRAGDVIVRVGNEHVANVSDWGRLMREQKAGPVQLGIIRDKRQQSLSITVPERSREQGFAIYGLEDLDTEGLKTELLRLQPEIERSVRDAQEKARRELERSQRELQRDMERLQRELERSQREQERAQRDAQREQEKAQREAQREQQRAQREAQREQQRAQREAESAQRDAQREQEKAQREIEREKEKVPEPPKPPQPN